MAHHCLVSLLINYMCIHIYCALDPDTNEIFFYAYGVELPYCVSRCGGIRASLHPRSMSSTRNLLKQMHIYKFLSIKSRWAHFAFNKFRGGFKPFRRPDFVSCDSTTANESVVSSQTNVQTRCVIYNAVGYGLYFPQGREYILFKKSRLALGLTSLPCNGYRGWSGRVVRLTTRLLVWKLMCGATPLPLSVFTACTATILSWYNSDLK
jgi:hypothetical protein